MDYRALGLRAGLEIHQQLDTRCKLFCGCPTRLRDTSEAKGSFFRFLRAVQSEMGEVDRAALTEARLNRRFVYLEYDTTCLVENDEEPPSRLNLEALEIALQLALLLKMKVVDEVHTMRKIVIDGSNTSGFQRTALVATDGCLETSQGRVGVSVLCLEEEAAQKVEERGDSVVYSLDRLGIPLVEIGTGPDIVSPAHAREVAEEIGMLLRSTGRVKRGLGTIRQDVNISIRDGARVEVKGVQELGLIETIVEREVLRQLRLLEIRDELKRRGASVPGEIVDVTHIFQETESKILKRAVKNRGRVMAVLLRGFGGLVGREIQPGRRLGTELSDYAKKAGVGGIFHTDELPGYGISQGEVDTLKRELGADRGDCVLLAADLEQKARRALEAAVERARFAITGIPEETRRALPDGNTAYMRPLPGAARMYPETDVPPVEIPASRLEKIELPETLREKMKRYQGYGLNEELARQIAYSRNNWLFEKIMRETDANPTLVVRTLEATLPELEKEGVPVDSLGEHHYLEVFKKVGSGGLPREALPELLKKLAENPARKVETVIQELGLEPPDQGEIEAFIEEIVKERRSFIQERGVGATGPLMGVVMKKLRGKAPGEKINRILREKIEKELENIKNS